MFWQSDAKRSGACIIDLIKKGNVSLLKMKKKKQNNKRTKKVLKKKT